MIVVMVITVITSHSLGAIASRTHHLTTMDISTKFCVNISSYICRILVSLIPL